jgi:hypothetical protein
MSNRFVLSVVGVAALLWAAVPGFAGTVPLGSAQSFAVLGAAGVTNDHSDPDPQTTIWGSVGIDPGPPSAPTGFSAGTVVGGTIYGPGDPSRSARLAAEAAYIYLAGLSGANLTGENLGGGRTITPGVYEMTDSVAYLNGVLNLDATGVPNARFVFDLTGALTTGNDPSNTSQTALVNVIGGDAGTEVYWRVGSAATLGDDTVFAGNIIAYASVVLKPRAKILCGRAFALTASVTLIDNLISNNNTAEDFSEITKVVRSDFGSYGFSGGPTAGPGVIPEPLTFGALALGLGSICGYLRRRKCAA